MDETFKASRLKSLQNDVSVLGIMATSAICFGLLVNQFRDKPLTLLYFSKSERIQQAVSRLTTAEVTKSVVDSNHLPQQLSLEEFRAFVENRRGLVLDARPEIFHRFGHVPGAFALPRDDFESAYGKLKAVLEVCKTRPLVVYCASASCEDHQLVCKALTALGYAQVSVFNGGWDAWTQAGLPEEKVQ